MFSHIEKPNSYKHVVNLDNESDLEEFVKWLLSYREGKLDLTIEGFFFTGNFVFLNINEIRAFCEGIQFATKTL